MDRIYVITIRIKKKGECITHSTHPHSIDASLMCMKNLWPSTRILCGVHCAHSLGSVSLFTHRRTFLHFQLASKSSLFTFGSHLRWKSRSQYPLLVELLLEGICRTNQLIQIIAADLAPTPRNAASALLALLSVWTGQLLHSDEDGQNMCNVSSCRL